MSGSLVLNDNNSYIKQNLWKNLQTLKDNLFRIRINPLEFFNYTKLNIYKR